MITEGGAREEQAKIVVRIGKSAYIASSLGCQRSAMEELQRLIAFFLQEPEDGNVVENLRMRTRLINCSRSSKHLGPKVQCSGRALVDPSHRTQVLLGGKPQSMFFRAADMLKCLSEQLSGFMMSAEASKNNPVIVRNRSMSTQQGRAGGAYYSGLVQGTLGLLQLPQGLKVQAEAMLRFVDRCWIARLLSV